MNPLRRFSSTVLPLFLAGACAQLIGLSDYEKGNEAAAKGGEGGEGDATNGGTRASGGTGGTGVKTGGTGGDAGDGAGGDVAQGGRPMRGGAGGDSGAGGEPGGETGQGGANATGGKATGGASTGGANTGGTNGGMSGGPSGGAGSGGGGTGGAPPTCTEISVGRLLLGDFDDTVDPALGYYVFEVNPPIGTSLPDAFEMEFWDGTPRYNGGDLGTFPLGAGTSGDSNYVSCSRCLVVYQDQGTTREKRFFQRSGSITLNPTSQHMTGIPNLTITNLTLEEVTWDDNTLISMPVEGGECLHVENQTVAIPPPTDWSCNAAWYTDSTCDCGCDQLDPVCPDSTSASCDYCWCNDASGNCMPNEVSATMNQFCN